MYTCLNLAIKKIAAARSQSSNSCADIIIVMGVSGSGKSTLGKEIAKHLNYTFIDADDFHCPTAKNQMQLGIGLTDEQRWPWLDRLSQELKDKQSSGVGIVLACSALKKAYRSHFRDHNGKVIFLWLNISAEKSYQRLHQREGHFATTTLLKSQFDTLEEPINEKDVIVVDA